MSVQICFELFLLDHDHWTKASLTKLLWFGPFVWKENCFPPGKCCKLFHRSAKLLGDARLHRGPSCRLICKVLQLQHKSSKLKASFKSVSSRQARMIDYVTPFTPRPKFLSFLTDARSRPSSPQLHFTPIHTWASNVFFSSVSASQRVESDSSQKSEIGSNCLAPEIWVFSKCTLKRSFTFCFAECKAYLPNLNWNNKTQRFFWTPEFNHLLHVIVRMKITLLSCRNPLSLWTPADVCDTSKSLRALASCSRPTQSPLRPGASSPSSLKTSAMLR